MKNNRIYSEDIRAAINLKEQEGLPFAINMFRLNEHQAKHVNEGTITGTSINAESSKIARKSQRERKVTPRMVEAATSMIHAGFTQQEISKIFDIDFRSLSYNLLHYDGYTTKTTNRFRA